MGMQTGAAPPPPGGDWVTVVVTAEEATTGTTKTVTGPDDRPMGVPVPPGVVDGTTFTLTGAGRPDPAGGPPGDLYVQVRVTPAGPAYPPGAYPPPGAPVPPYPTSAAPYPTPGAPYPASGPPGGPYPGSGGPYAAPGAPYPPGAYPPGAYPPGAYPPPTPPRRNRAVPLIGVGLALVLLVGCCGGSWLLFGGDDDADTRSVAGRPGSVATGAPGPTTAAVSPAQYQQALATADKTLTGAYAKLGAAKNPAAVEDAAGAFGQAVRSAADQLTAVAPPAAAEAGHRSLLDALDGLAEAARDTGSAGADRKVCAGTAAAALFRRSPAGVHMRTAAQALAGVDPTYKVGSFLPAETKDTNRRLANGSYVKRTGGGSGQFKIDNGGSVDATISLVKSGTKKPAITVYVRGKGKFTVNGVKDGTYQVFMASGTDWDAKNRTFARDCGYSRFDDAFKFTTTSSQYTIWSITLTPVAGGNASTTDVDPDAFPAD